MGHGGGVRCRRAHEATRDARGQGSSAVARFPAPGPMGGRIRSGYPGNSPASPLPTPSGLPRAVPSKGTYIPQQITPPGREIFLHNENSYQSSCRGSSSSTASNRRRRKERHRSRTSARCISPLTRPYERSSRHAAGWSSGISTSISAWVGASSSTPPTGARWRTTAAAGRSVSSGTGTGCAQRRYGARSTPIPRPVRSSGLITPRSSTTRRCPRTYVRACSACSGRMSCRPTPITAMARRSPTTRCPPAGLLPCRDATLRLAAW